MKYLYILSVGALMIGCHPKAPLPDALIPPPPKHTESVAPNISKVGQDVKEAHKANIKMDSKLKESGKLIQNQRVAIQLALDEANRMKDQLTLNEVITIEQVVRLSASVKEAGEKNVYLEKLNNELADTCKAQEVLLSITQDNVSDILYKLALRDSELAELQSQNKYLGGAVDSKNKDVVSLKDQLDKSKKDAASAGVYKHWIIGLVIAFVIWTILKNVLMMYLPTTKFRL